MSDDEPVDVHPVWIMANRLRKCREVSASDLLPVEARDVAWQLEAALQRAGYEIVAAGAVEAERVKFEKELHRSDVETAIAARDQATFTERHRCIAIVDDQANRCLSAVDQIGANACAYIRHRILETPES